MGDKNAPVGNVTYKSQANTLSEDFKIAYEIMDGSFGAWFIH